MTLFSLLFVKANGNWLRKIAVGDGFDISVDVAVEHVDNAGGISGESWVVGDHNDGVAFEMDVFELFHNDVGGAGIEVAGWFVGEDDFWVGNDGASDSNALLLAAGKLPRHVIFAFFKMKTAEGTGSLSEAVSFGIAGIN